MHLFPPYSQPCTYRRPGETMVRHAFSRHSLTELVRCRTHRRPRPTPSHFSRIRIDCRRDEAAME